MKLVNYIYNCSYCGKKIMLPEIPFETYGEFLLRSDSGEIAYLDAINSASFNEYCEMIENHSELKVLDKMEKARIAHQLIGFFCDFAKDGTKYNLKRTLRCQNCNSGTILGYEKTDPLQFVDVDIPHVSFDRWNGLSPTAKKKLVDQVLKKNWHPS